MCGKNWNHKLSWKCHFLLEKQNDFLFNYFGRFKPKFKQTDHIFHITFFMWYFNDNSVMWYIVVYVRSRVFLLCLVSFLIQKYMDVSLSFIWISTLSNTQSKRTKFHMYIMIVLNWSSLPYINKIRVQNIFFFTKFY